MPSPPSASPKASSPAIQLSPTQAKFLPYMLAIALFMQILDATILNTALPEMATALNESALKMQWTIISYALTLAVFIPVSGFLADKIGTRKVFLTAVVIFSLGSLLCAMSPNLELLILARIVQGIGGAMMTPVARLILVKSYPRERLLSVMNFAVIPALVAPLLGPLLGGYIVQYSSWHWIFLINLPMGLAGFLLGMKLVPSLTEVTTKFDWLGFVLVALAMSGMTLGVDFLSEHVVWAIGLIAVSIGILLAYVGHAKRHPDPLFGLDLFTVRTFRVGIIGNLITRLGISALPFLLPLLLQLVFNYTPSQAGWLMAPIAVGAIGIKPLVTPLIRKFTYRKTLVANTMLLGGLTMTLALYGQGVPWWGFVPLLFVVGACNSLQFSAMNTITIGDLHGKQTSSGNSLIAVNQQLAIGFGIALGATVLNIFRDNLHFEVMSAFHYSFVILGLITMLSGLYFLKLDPDDGRGLY